VHLSFTSGYWLFFCFFRATQFLILRRRSRKKAIVSKFFIPLNWNFFYLSPWKIKYFYVRWERSADRLLLTYHLYVQLIQQKKIYSCYYFNFILYHHTIFTFIAVCAMISLGAAISFLKWYISYHVNMLAIYIVSYRIRRIIMQQGFKCMHTLWIINTTNACEVNFA